MKLAHLLLFLVIIPPIAAICHDLYLFYLAQDAPQIDADFFDKLLNEERPARQFSFAAFGFLWLEYSPETYKTFKNGMEAENWEFFQQFLKLKAFYVTGILAAISYLIAALVWLLKSFKVQKKKRDMGSYRRKSAIKKKEIQYKRN